MTELTTLQKEKIDLMLDKATKEKDRYAELLDKAPDHSDFLASYNYQCGIIWGIKDMCKLLGYEPFTVHYGREWIKNSGRG